MIKEPPLEGPFAFKHVLVDFQSRASLFATCLSSFFAWVLYLFLFSFSVLLFFRCVSFVFSSSCVSSASSQIQKAQPLTAWPRQKDSAREQKYDCPPLPCKEEPPKGIGGGWWSTAAKNTATKCELPGIACLIFIAKNHNQNIYKRKHNRKL